MRAPQPPPHEEHLVFVFQEPRSKTDIPQAELSALIELAVPEVCFDIIDVNARMTASRQTHHPGFLLFDARVDDANYRIAHLAFLEQCAIVLTNFPLDIEKIVTRSGYVHSAGDLVFLAEWGALSTDNVPEHLVRYASHHGTYFPLHFYTRSAHEKYHDHLRELCIDDTRYHVGQAPFSKASGQISDNYELAAKTAGLERHGEGAFFLCKDTSRLPRRSPLDELYDDRAFGDFALCYRSKYKKDDPIHSLDGRDEAKPYWAGIFTTPHRLTNAMLNLARVSAGSVVVDPFCHTGTVAIEACKLGAIIIAADKSEPIGAKDNYDFLCCGGSHMAALSVELLALANDTVLHDAFNTLASSSVELNTHGLPCVRNGMEVEELVDQAASNGLDFRKLSHRLYFYLVRRFHMQQKRGSKQPHLDAAHLAKQFIGVDGVAFGDDMTYFHVARLLERYEGAARDSGTRTPTILPELGLFSDHVYKSKRVGCLNEAKSLPRFVRADITAASDDAYGIPENSVDAVVADPPYGYGEDLSRGEVVLIYQRFFAKSLRWLKSGGRLVFCALDKVRTGRTDETLVLTEDILQLLNRVMRAPDVSAAIGQRHVYPIGRWPQYLFYWKSRFALNRSVIAVEILKERSNVT